MLLRFEVSNHRSILEPVELSFIAVDDDRSATRGFDQLSERVLTTVGIYGPNASGKSNILDALAWLAHAVRTSLRGWDEIIPRDPHRFGGASADPSVFKVELMADDVRYEYRLEVNDERVLHESLHSYPVRRRRTLFERKDMEITFRRGSEGQSAIRELTTPTTLTLSTGHRYNNEISIIASSLRGIAMHGTPAPRTPRGRRPTIGGGLLRASTAQLFDPEQRSRQTSLFSEGGQAAREAAETALAMLRFADLGIEDVRIEEREEGRGIEIQLVHKTGSTPFALDLSQESAGTQTWFRLIGPALSALHQGKLLLLDEIDASLHPHLSSRIVDLFQDPDTNQHDAQLLFTTHDTSLLNTLNRDEIWLTEKTSSGETTLTALSDFGGDQVRRSTNLEKAYLHGRFGGLPHLDQAMIREAIEAPSPHRSVANRNGQAKNRDHTRNR